MQITGATFFDGLYPAAQTELASSYLLRVWSLNVDACKLVAGCDRRLDTERELVGESQGLAVACTSGRASAGAVLHWLVAPHNEARQMPTFWDAPYRHGALDRRKLRAEGRQGLDRLRGGRHRPRQPLGRADRLPA